jgi:hypothetical protein
LWLMQRRAWKKWIYCSINIRVGMATLSRRNAAKFLVLSQSRIFRVFSIYISVNSVGLGQNPSKRRELSKCFNLKEISQEKF